MQDAEYLAYLKKQSYEDLVSISQSIDKQAQSERYAMVIAEIMERDRVSKEPKQIYASSQSAISRKLLCIGLLPCIFALHCAIGFLLYRACRNLHTNDITDLFVVGLPFLSAMVAYAYALHLSNWFRPFKAWRAFGMLTISLFLAFFSLWGSLFAVICIYGE